MKLTGVRLEQFLDAPDAGMRAALIYGPDAGLVRERADRIAAAIVPDRNDAFRVSDLAADTLAGDPARLDDEARAMSLMPGRRLVRVRDAGDAVAVPFDRLFKAAPPGDSFIVVEAGDLAARSALRRAFESARQAAAIPCYADGPAELRALVRATMEARRIAVDAEALDYLVAHLGGDRMLSRQELEKLALYVGDGGRLGYEAAAAVVGDSATATIEDAVYAAAEGEIAALERALRRAFDEGEAAVTVLRAALRHFQRLHLAASRIAAGVPAEDAVDRLRPPPFFKLRPRFLAQLRRWPERAAAAALEILFEAERDAKRTGLPAETICGEALLRVARSRPAGRERRPGAAR
ncbi:MAG TPA: DNA polymerase III subunit delta [Stellaceae bacterium]|nr:DNA polymerase III subunit delta [Stellaceae bacterium]